MFNAVSLKKWNFYSLEISDFNLTIDNIDSPEIFLQSSCRCRYCCLLRPHLHYQLSDHVSAQPEERCSSAIRLRLVFIIPRSCRHQIAGYDVISNKAWNPRGTRHGVVILTWRVLNRRVIIATEKFSHNKWKWDQQQKTYLHPMI